MSTYARDWFDTEAEFIEMLETAEENATSDWEMTFVDSISTRAKQYGGSTYLSEEQYEKLKKIAEK